MNLSGRQQECADVRSGRHLGRSVSAVFLVLGALLCARPLAAQTLDSTTAQTPAGSSAVQAPTDPNPGALSLSGGIDFLNQYMFRGIRQNSTGFATWPWADLGVAAYSEFQRLGDTTKSFNGGDSSQVIGSIGIGFSY